MFNTNQLHRTRTLGGIAVLGLSLALLFGCDNSQNQATDDHQDDHEHEDASQSAAEDLTVPKVDAMMLQLVANYPLDTCVISGDALDVMGDPVNHMVEGQLVRFCCNDCLAQFEKDPQKYLAKIEGAASADAQPTSDDADPSHDHAEHTD